MTPRSIKAPLILARIALVVICAVLIVRAALWVAGAHPVNAAARIVIFYLVAAWVFALTYLIEAALFEWLGPREIHVLNSEPPVTRAQTRTDPKDAHHDSQAQD